MLYYSIDSKEKVVHYKSCHHFKNIKKENLRSFGSIKDVRNSDYRICSCCSPVISHLKQEHEKLEKFCLENGLFYALHKGNLFVSSHSSRWKVLASDNRNVLELHHENSFKNDYSDSVKGYHKQKFTSDSVLGYFDYIINHDYYRMLNPLNTSIPKKPPKKGTKRYKNQQKYLAMKERKRKIWNVVNLIDSLSAGSCVAQA